MTSVQLDETKCKGIVQQGPRTGLQCQKERPESGYCVYHQRNLEYDTLITQGKKLCSGFFRGCNAELSEEDVKQFLKFCAACRLKKSGKQFPCKSKGCSAKIFREEDKYCNKHTRELLRDDEKENNVQYCDISRGCFNVLTDDIKCTECRDREKQKAAAEMAMLRKAHKIILPERSEKDELFEKQEATASEIKEVWRNLHRNAMLRKILFTLTQEEFEKLVIQSCYYCGFYSKHKFIGIDRIDNNKGYISSNCLSACKMCNMIKHVDHPNAFLDKVSLICSYRQSHKSIREKTEVKWPSYLTYGKMTFNAYKYLVEKERNLQFLISQSHYETLINGECYLCGINPMEGHRNGIDRYDSNGDYTIDNCRTCCGHCNRMKRDYLYDDFIRKCIQIKAHNCDRSRFTNVSFVDPEAQKLRNEYYTAEDIAKFLKDGYLTCFLEWCEEKQKTVEFTSAITHIASKLEGDIVAQVRHELDNERARKSNQQTAPEIKQHLHCGTVYIWLTSGKEDDFVEWFTSQYEKTALFDKRFKELKESLLSLSKEGGIKACKKFMYDEKSRRNAQKTRDKKQESAPKYSKSSRTLKPIVEESEEPVNTIVYLPPPRIQKSVLSSLTPAAKQTIPVKKPEKAAPKQWKVADIYKYISAGKYSVYYEYLKENNATETISGFETKWLTLLQEVSGKTQEEAESVIKDFVLWLRNIRHNEVCATANAKKTLEKEDRQHYRADGILTLLNANDANELAKFKAHTEDYTGDKAEDVKWMKRWNGFLADVKAADTDPAKKRIISKFLAAQRKKKYDRVKV
jgi:hypothetical protein